MLAHLHMFAEILGSQYAAHASMSLRGFSSDRFGGAPSRPV
jgi:hypothetical protein